MAFRLRIFGIPVSIGRHKKRSPKAGRTKARKKKRETDPVVSQTKEPQVQEAAFWDDTKARKLKIIVFETIYTFEKILQQVST